MVVVKRPPSPDYETQVDVGEKVIIPAPNARQGLAQHNVRNILIISLSVVILLMIIAYFGFFAG